MWVHLEMGFSWIFTVHFVGKLQQKKPLEEIVMRKNGNGEPDMILPSCSTKP